MNADSNLYSFILYSWGWTLPQDLFIVSDFFSFLSYVPEFYN